MYVSYTIVVAYIRSSSTVLLLWNTYGWRGVVDVSSVELNLEAFISERGYRPRATTTSHHTASDSSEKWEKLFILVTQVSGMTCSVVLKRVIQFAAIVNKGENILNFLSSFWH